MSLKPGCIQCHRNLSNCSGEKQCPLYIQLREANMKDEATDSESVEAENLLCVYSINALKLIFRRVLSKQMMIYVDVWHASSLRYNCQCHLQTWIHESNSP